MDQSVSTIVLLALLLLITLYWASTDRGEQPDLPKPSPRRRTGRAVQRPLSATTGLAIRLRWLLDDVPTDHPARPHLEAALKACESPPRAGISEDRMLGHAPARRWAPREEGGDAHV